MDPYRLLAAIRHALPQVLRWGLRLGLPLAALVGIAWFTLDLGAGNVASALRRVGTIDAARVGFRWSGDVVIEDLRLTPAAVPEVGGLRADRVVVETPGPFWLLRAAFRSAISGPATEDGSTGRLPAAESLTLRIENPVLGDRVRAAAGLGWFGIASASPFEAQGCGAVRYWTRADLERMGLPPGPAVLTLEYASLTDSAAQVRAELSVPGAGRAERTLRLLVAEPARMVDTVIEEIRVTEDAWRIVDEGFVAARNRHCAQRARTTRNQFMDRHVGAADAWLRQNDLVATPEMVDAYRRFATRGGEMVWRAKPKQVMALRAWRALPPPRRMALLEASLVTENRKPVPFVLSFPSEQAAAVAALGDPAAAGAPVGAVPGAETGAPPAAPAAAATGSPASATSPGAAGNPAPGAVASVTPATPVPATPAPVAAPTPASSTASTAPSAPPAPAPVAPTPPAATPGATANASPAAVVRTPRIAAGVVKYEDLARAIGRRVAIDTIYHTRRTGILRGYTATALRLQLPASEGGLELTLPSTTVTGAEILGDDLYLVPNESR